TRRRDEETLESNDHRRTVYSLNCPPSFRMSLISVPIYGHTTSSASKPSFSDRDVSIDLQDTSISVRLPRVKLLGPIFVDVVGPLMATTESGKKAGTNFLNKYLAVGIVRRDYGAGKVYRSPNSAAPIATVRTYNYANNVSKAQSKYYSHMYNKHVPSSELKATHSQHDASAASALLARLSNLSTMRSSKIRYAASTLAWVLPFHARVLTVLCTYLRRADVYISGGGDLIVAPICAHESGPIWESVADNDRYGPGCNANEPHAIAPTTLEA
ncbi:hypothetical protein DBV15_07175, partial [Temnothorax longispinosus]